jgi:hypothetical protein
MPPPRFDTSAESERALGRRSLVNLSRMGHCAPTVMQTMLDATGVEAEWLVKLSAGLPGGIGNTGAECGGVTAPLILFGLRGGLDTKRRRLPLIVYQGHDLMRRFRACQGTTSCREIRGDDRLPLRCVSVIRKSPSLCARTLASECRDVLSQEQERAYARLYAHWIDQDFHCAHAVLRATPDRMFASEDLRKASSGFLGGTVFTGMTCSAFTAGVMALGLALGKLENSRWRVLRMITTMAAGGDAFVDELNAFNATMNLGHRLSEWFVAEFGTTRCVALTGCDFSTDEGVRRYLENGGTTRCRVIADSVARRTQELIEASRSAE